MADPTHELLRKAREALYETWQSLDYVDRTHRTTGGLKRAADLARATETLADLDAALSAPPTTQAPANIIPPGDPLTKEQVGKILKKADWPPIILSDFVRRKLEVLVREVERAHNIGEEKK